MADELVLEIVTPEKMAYSGYVEEVTISGTEGEFCVLRGHAALLTAVNTGELSFTKDNRKTFYAVTTGYSEVTTSKVTVLVETAERSDMIDKERAKRAKENAEVALAKMSKYDVEFESSSRALLRAITRISIAEKHGS